MFFDVVIELFSSSDSKPAPLTLRGIFWLAKNSLAEKYLSSGTINCPVLVSK